MFLMASAACAVYSVAMFSVSESTQDFARVLGIPLAVILVGLASFGLGRLSMIEEMRPEIMLQNAAAAEAIQPIALGGLIVASRSGSTYHYPWCAGAQQIAEQNKRWFKSEEEARKAGYKAAKNCKGLE